MNARPIIKTSVARLLLVAASLSGSLGLTAQSGIKLEYFFDRDPGVGEAVQTDVEPGSASIAVPTENLSEGAHIFSVRAIDAEGRVSSTVVRPLYVCNEALYQQAEYFIDTDPGAGNATAIPGAPSRRLAFEVGTTSLSIGPHTMNARVKGNDGEWTPVVTAPFIITEPLREYDMNVEYFYDDDPGVGSGVRIEGAIGRNLFWLPTDGLTAGAHLLSIRLLDKEGRWSWTVCCPVYVVTPTSFARAEYFVDTDPGIGNATEIALSSNGETVFSVPTQDMKPGDHSLTLRACDETGNWHVIAESPFRITDATGGVSAVLMQHFTLTRNGDRIVIHSANVAPGSLVSVYGIDGRLISTRVWSDPDTDISLEAPANVIVTVTDGKSMRATRHIL